MMRRISWLISIGAIVLLLLSLYTQGDEITRTEEITFTNNSKIDRSIVLTIPNGAEISYFSFELAGPITAGAGQPTNLNLDIGDNGTIDWGFPQEYGPLGYQNVFDNGNKELELRFVPGNYNRSGGIYLHPTAEISKAALEISYSQEDYISPFISELNRPEWHTEAPYDYDPEMCEFQDRLYVAYRSYSWRDSNQSDADIVINSTSDGLTWQDETIELTKAPDTEVPYLGGKRAGDFYPSLEVFKNKLYCAWESDSRIPQGSTHDSDRDIIWNRYDGVNWSEPQELSAPVEQAAEGKYSMNPGSKEDQRVQLCTFNNGTGEQLFAIWVANNTGDEEFPGGWIGDIIVSKTTDGEHWSTGLDLTADDKRYDNDTMPQLVEYETTSGNALFAFWVTNSEQLTNGSDLDIVYRYTLDGETWSDYFNLIDACGIIESSKLDQAIDDDPLVIVFNDELYVFWRTSNPLISTGEDIDIVMVYTADGLNWSTPLEVTPSTDSMYNNRPKATVYQDKLMVLWVTWSHVEGEDRGTLFLSILDNNTYHWSEPIAISIEGDEVNDYSPDILAFKDKLMISWVSQDNITTPGIDSDVVVRSIILSNGMPNIALDIGGNDKFSDNWLVPKRAFTDDEKVTVDITTRLQELFLNEEYLKMNTREDEFRNEIVFLPINSYFSAPGRLMLASLEIQYNYSFLIPDLSESLTGYVKEYIKERNNDEKEKGVKVTLRFESSTYGELRLRNLRVSYTMPDKPREGPEFLCIIALGIILIIIGVVLKLVRSKPAKHKEQDEDIDKKQN